MGWVCLEANRDWDSAGGGKEEEGSEGRPEEGARRGKPDKEGEDERTPLSCLFLWQPSPGSPEELFIEPFFGRDASYSEGSLGKRTKEL